MVSLEFLIDVILPAALGVDTISNKIEYLDYFVVGKGGRCVMLTTLLPSCDECFEIWEPQPAGTLRVCPGLYRDCFTFTFIIYQCYHNRQTRSIP